MPTGTIQPLIKQQLDIKFIQYKAYALAMGRTGVGKTTLVNGLCGTKHEAGSGHGSKTRNLFRNDTNIGEGQLALIDTPGTDSTTEAYRHAHLLRTALITGNINTIFIVIKYDSRYDKMVINYREVEIPVRGYRHKIVIIVSYWDISERPKQDFEGICNEFKKNGINCNIIFYSNKSALETMVNLMYSCVSNMDEERLEINDNDFYLNFNLMDIKLEIEESSREFARDALSLCEEFKQTAMRVHHESVPDGDEILHMLIVEFEREMDQLLKKFTDKHGNSMATTDDYISYINMQKKTVEFCDIFVKTVRPLMSYNLCDIQDPRNLIKRCPNCNLIWFKAEGCDGTTDCGNNNFSNRFDVSKRSHHKFQLKRINGKLQWEKLSNVVEPSKYFIEAPEMREMPNASVNATHDQQFSDNDMSSAEGLVFNHMMDENELQVEVPNDGNNLVETKSHRKRMGCGTSFVWKNLPKIEDELILQLLTVKTMELAKQKISEEYFTHMCTNRNKNIDSIFHS
ncbi:unnamed protein product [Didymodactylos carnosus]|uniref:G domain-containing protein n=1 Tax=Didymodactylos carnosus TaxID=1234261 RepID=A0A8S2DK25_9BILA|nr:unnamed protein product [Didymodactylos carnosus]CAF3733405.1 unnamed protein product [Didymodactylos carnosus]